MMFFRGGALGGAGGGGDKFVGNLVVDGMTNGELANHDCFSGCGLRGRWFRELAVAWNGRGESAGDD